MRWLQALNKRGLKIDSDSHSRKISTTYLTATNHQRDAQKCPHSDDTLEENAMRLHGIPTMLLVSSPNALCLFQRLLFFSLPTATTSSYQKTCWIVLHLHYRQKAGQSRQGPSQSLKLGFGGRVVVADACRRFHYPSWTEIILTSSFGLPFPRISTQLNLRKFPITSIALRSSLSENDCDRSCLPPQIAVGLLMSGGDLRSGVYSKLAPNLPQISPFNVSTPFYCTKYKDHQDPDNRIKMARPIYA
jgi:hypothetical protein